VRSESLTVCHKVGAHCSRHHHPRASQVVGLAVANMSVIYRMSLRLLEQGVVDVVNSYILPHADAHMR
jgi:hypothetical protein